MSVLEVDVELLLLDEVVKTVGCITLGRHMEHAKTERSSRLRIAPVGNQAFGCVDVPFEGGQMQWGKIVSKGPGIHPRFDLLTSRILFLLNEVNDQSHLTSSAR